MPVHGARENLPYSIADGRGKEPDSLEGIMENRKVELLAPAGSFACFRAAVNAGADAVYLGGEKYGARAYADNFSTEEIIEALRIAHIFGRKIYLTVNTLVKEEEFADLVPYIEPLYHAGLDGAIVQDIGVLQCLHSSFPSLALHASTQMTITGAYGAVYMEKLGVCRVVPARELSLDEIRDIKNKTKLEIECFIHGAMCYAYSGQCLFSSVLGGRSGNRGRCAGPCRLPYMDSHGAASYPLSLKDMYTLSILPELIQAGIDSFKIEGRMKSPEYVAGVTAVYRRYIDGYLENPDKPYKVSKQDEQLLRRLYIRSDICTGYYHKHNGKSMVTLKKPGYSGSAPEVIKNIQERYISKNISLPITGYVRIHAGEQAVLTLSYGNTSVTAAGECVSAAVNRPLDEHEISKRLGKLGDTCFELTDLMVDTDNSSFMPVKALNELRRMACSKLEKALSGPVQPSKPKESCKIKALHQKTDVMTKRVNELCILTATVKQLLAANSFSEIRRIYVDADIFICARRCNCWSKGSLPLHGTSAARQLGEKDISLLNSERTRKGKMEQNCPTEFSLDTLLMPEKEYILVMPHIFRKKSWKYLDEYERLLKSGRFAGVMVRNFEEMEWLCGIGYTGAVCSDYTVYAWNQAAMDFLSRQFDEITLPLELNRKELGRLSADSSLGFMIYGFIPLMYSANCIRNTLEGCIDGTLDANTNMYRLTDRYKNVFTIKQNCTHCYNTLYNTVPLSLHGQLDSILKRNYNVLRLDFSIEDEEQTRAVIAYYLNLVNNAAGTAEGFPFKEFTNGHYKRGVE